MNMQDIQVQLAAVDGSNWDCEYTDAWGKRWWYIDIPPAARVRLGYGEDVEAVAKFITTAPSDIRALLDHVRDLKVALKVILLCVEGVFQKSESGFDEDEWQHVRDVAQAALKEDQS